MFKTAVVLCAFLMITVNASPARTTTPAYQFQLITLEEPCVRQGGICVRTEDCEPDNLPRIRDLCPMQKGYGVVCCYV